VTFSEYSMYTVYGKNTPGHFRL